MTEAVGELFHHMRGEMRMLLNEKMVALIAFFEKEIAWCKLQRVGVFTERVRRIHEGREYKWWTTSAKLQLCDRPLRVVSGPNSFLSCASWITFTSFDE